MAEALAEVMTEGAFINGALMGISENRHMLEGHNPLLRDLAWDYYYQKALKASAARGIAASRCSCCRALPGARWRKFWRKFSGSACFQ